MELSYQTNQAQNQRQTQKLILSARMKESLDILQMPFPELQKKIEAEILENPVLERDQQCAMPEKDGRMYKERGQESERQSVGTSTRYDYHAASFSRDVSLDSLDNASQVPTFRSFLLEQLSELKVGPSTAKICRYIIDSLDEKGYLRDSAEEIAAGLGIPKAKAVGFALKIVKGMEPAGVGASDLRECLLLQAARQPEFNPAAAAIISQHLDLLAENKVREIAQRLDISVADAQDCCNAIRKLNPIPSSGFHTGTCEKFVFPEATVKFDESGVLCIESNENETKRLFINPIYARMAKSTDDADVKKYLADKIKRASALIDDISNREKTILRIVEMVVKLQPQYFKTGRTCIKPMSMKFLAEKLGLNESTVSRTVQDKFILCPFGMIPLRALFTHTVNAAQNGSAVSAAAIKDHIKKIVEREDRVRPYSDQEIAVELRRYKMNIARRTVAKYREELSIPSMAKRKLYKIAG